LTGLLIIVTIGVTAAFQGNGDPGRLLELNSDSGVFFGITSATALAFFSLVGFEDSVNMVEETHDPTRTFPRAILTGIVICATIYLLVPVEVLEGSTAPLLEVVRV